MMSRIYDDKLWSNDRVYELGKKSTLPSERDVKSQPWYGLDYISSYSSGGKVNSMFHRMLSGVSGTDKEQDLRQAIEKTLEGSPSWQGGWAMLALIDLKNDETEAAKKRLSELFSEEKLDKEMPAHACWIIGQELDQF